ncbi:MAG: SDR family NAD(P)-dependent oxidoreductase [Chloroflexota bacterium]|nr:SDR family NAD(P)-dependent oxidoreductase [Chloroflexota bacterium]
MKPQVVLITGANSGIGKETAKRFAQTGYVTYGGARRESTFSELTAIGCLPIRVDVTDEASMIAAVQHIEQAHGGVDVLVNNAGYGQLGPLEEIAMADMRRQFETNVFGLLRLSQLVLPEMRRRKSGRIINVSSVGGEVTFPGAGAYHMSKYAVESLNDALRYEVKPFGVKVISIQPGGVATQFVAAGESTFDWGDPASPYHHFRKNLITTTRNMFTENSPFGILTPQQVANVILHAAQSRRPRGRYKVGVLATLTPHVRRWIPDRLWDSMMTMLFPVETVLLPRQ